MASINSTKEIHISVVTERLDIVYTLTPETYAEDVIIYVCKTLKISPVTRHLFGLRLSKKFWVALNGPLWALNRKKLAFRIRFKVPNVEKLRRLDHQTFNFYFAQVRRDVLDGAVPDITCIKHKQELMGLGVTDMYRDILEHNVPRSEVLNNYKKYIPKEISKSHFIFAKKKMDENLSLIINQGGVNDVAYLKSGYLEEFEGIAPNYLIEEYDAWVIESEATKAISIVVNPYHDDMPGILYKCSDVNEWQHICSIEDLCFISLRDDGSVEISRKTGIPLYIMFDSISTAISFVSLLDGYYRLSVKWTFNLCKELSTPSLLRLKKLKCHGPVGGKFSYAKLEEKRNNKPGCYILRESEESFDKYYIDLCTKKSNTPVTYSILTKTNGTFWFAADKESYVSIQSIVDKYSCPTKNFCLLECLPSSEYDESNLLLCHQSEMKPASCNMIKSLNFSYGPTQCIHVKDLQIFRGKMLDEEFTQMYKCLWKRSKKEKVEVALKSLKPLYHDHFLKDFLKLASDWGLLQSSSFVNLIGVTLSDPISMIMEFFPLGPLNKYLQANKKLIKEVDLVEAATYLANALWLMEEEGFAHGFIRCEKILVASHTDNSFFIRLADPGLFQNYKDYDLHWIPPEYHDYPEAARKSFSADIWAFGTTLWEIFAYGDKPPYTTIRSASGEICSLREFYRSGKKLKSPPACPKHVYNLIEECWHADPALRKKPQAAKRDINQFLYQVFNSRLKHPYATILPTAKSKSSSFDTLNDVNSEALDDYSLKSLSTQLSFVSWGDDASSPQISSNFSDVDTESLLDSQLDLATQSTYDFSQVSTIMPDLDFPGSGTPIGGISSLQSIFELSQDVNVVLQGKIGQGFYGEVYQGVIEDINSSKDPPTVAVKRLKNFDNSSWNNDFLREIDIMKKLKHPCIVEMKCVILEPEVNLVMEYVPHGSLKCYLKINKDRLDTKIHILKYALDVAKGMEYLGQMKIVHRDLAARNVLVADEFSVKISDFGLAQFIGPSDYYVSQTNRELPIKWFAPESLRYGKFSGQSDVWSYGVTLYEMFSHGEEPIIESFEESVSLLDALDKGIRLPCPPSCPDEVYVKLMIQCWNSEGKNRPLFSNIITIVEQLRED